MIERVKISAAAKQQLITLKRKTGIEHYNVICRHALILSLSNPATAPTENIQFANGLEIDWNVLAGDSADTYLNLLIIRTLIDDGQCTPLQVRQTLTSHLHRGLSYLASQHEALVPQRHMDAVT
jgi:DNA sulfur modification protein DndE